MSDTLLYAYDALNRLRAVRKNGTLIVRYAYDVSGRRIVKNVYSTATGGTLAYTRFVYRGPNVGFETDSAGTIELRYTWGPAADDLIGIRDAAGNHYYVVQDKLRSVRGLVKRDGTWIMSRRFGAYGAIVADTASAALGFELRYRWTTREYDAETGWYYFRARYYDQGVRRFVQEDPIGYGGGENLYAYVGGNPVDRRDPSGMTWDDAVKVNWRDLYLWNNCWNDRCDENLWRRGEAWRGFGGWGLLTLLERSAIYEDYFAKATANIKSVGGQSVFRPMYKETEFKAFVNALGEISNDLYKAFATAGLDAGAFVVQSGVFSGNMSDWNTTCCGRGSNPATTAGLPSLDANPWNLEIRIPLTWMHRSAFDQSASWLANLIVHETLHWLTLGDGSRANHCWIYQQAGRSTGTTWWTPPTGMC